MMRVRLAGVVLSLALIPGCTTAEPKPQDPTIATTPATAPSGGPIVPTTGPRPTSAPPVTRPLDLAPYLRRPCDLFTDSDAASIGFTRPGDGRMIPTDMAKCSRVGGSSEPWLLYFVSVDSDQFASYFRPGHDPKWLRQTTVAGQPAVELSDEAAPSSHCRVVVAVAERQALDVDVRDTPVGSAWICDRVARVADVMVRRLGGG